MSAATYAYGRRTLVASVIAQDILLAAVAVAFAATRGGGALGGALAVGAAVVLGWGVVTLHYPSRVDVDERAITFTRYGRAHRFAWADVDALHVRRFLVRDRVLVRIGPSAPFRGRYWLLDGLEGFDALVRGLEARAASTRSRRAA